MRSGRRCRVLRLEGACAALLWLVLATGVRAQPYALDWWSVDGGGAAIAATPYSLGFTVGQPDAGAAVGGQYALTSGFWAVASTAIQPTPPPTSTPTITPTPSETPTPSPTRSATPTPSPTPSVTPVSVSALGWRGSRPVALLTLLLALAAGMTVRFPKHRTGSEEALQEVRG